MLVYNTPPRVCVPQVIVVLLQQLQLGKTQSTCVNIIVVDVSVFTCGGVVFGLLTPIL